MELVKYSREAERYAVDQIPLLDCGKRIALHVPRDWSGNLCAHVGKMAHINSVSRYSYEDRNFTLNDTKMHIICDLQPVLHNDALQYVIISSNMSVMRRYQDVTAGNVIKVFDSTVSTHLLLYRWLKRQGRVTGDELPRSVKYFDDILTRVYSLEGSRPLDAWVSACTITTELTVIDGQTDAEFALDVSRGNAIVKYRENLLKQSCIGKLSAALLIDDDVFDLVVVVSSVFVDELSEYILDKDPKKIVAICRYNLNGGKWMISMRCIESKFNVGKYCETRGGGGSMHSGGFMYTGDIENVFPSTVRGTTAGRIRFNRIEKDDT